MLKQSLQEFELIEKIAKSQAGGLKSGYLGIGDDCAAIPKSKSESWIITTDLMVEGIHFLRDQISPRNLGYKLAAVNLSDIAAKGGVPQFAFLSLALDKRVSPDWVLEFYRGLRGLLGKYNIQILGGDTTGSKKGIFVNLLLVGTQKTGNLKLRSFAKMGDVVFVSSHLGDSAGGLKLLLKKGNLNDSEKALVRRHLKPRPQLEEGSWLSKQKPVGAMMDVSDGIASDLRRVSEQSKCGFSIQLDKIPMSNTLKRVCISKKWNALELAVAGGEDYCLLGTCRPNQWENLNRSFKLKFKRNLFQIGTVTGGRKVEYFLNGKKSKVPFRPFSHF